MESIFDKESDIMECPVGGIIHIFRGKWMMPIVYYLSFGTLRFAELSRKVPYITESNLTKELRLLEKYGMVHREVYPVVPPKVEYSLTDKGEHLIPVMKAIEEFGRYYYEE